MKSLVARAKVDSIADYVCKPRNGGTHAMLALLGRLQAKEVAAELTRILRGAEKQVPAFPVPKEIEDLQAKAPPAAKGDKGGPQVVNVRVEAEVMKLVECIPYETEENRLKVANEAAEKLKSVADNILGMEKDDAMKLEKDEDMAILMIELWSTMGRHVLQNSNTAQGFKF